VGPALIVHDAVATIEGRKGVREELVGELYVGPGTTTLASSDIITSFFLPHPPARFGSAHIKLGKRGSGTDIALAGVSASVVLGEQAEITACRIVLVSLGPTPMRAPATEALLQGEIVTEAQIAAAGASAGREAKPISDMRASASYRTTLAEVLTRRALRQAVVAAGPRVAA
jgi:carbon-monoxide dehydrogenase medium subunit